MKAESWAGLKMEEADTSSMGFGTGGKRGKSFGVDVKKQIQTAGGMSGTGGPRAFQFAARVQF